MSGKDTSDWLPRVLFESALIVMSILVALGLDEWRENREAAETVSQALLNFDREIRQNQAQIEQDIRDTLNNIGLDQDDAMLRQYAEQVIRNYDPCISCATHFLDLTVKRL